MGRPTSQVRSLSMKILFLFVRDYEMRQAEIGSPWEMI